MQSLLLTAQNTWINENGNVEMTPRKAIDQSKIISDWYRLTDSVKPLQDKVVEKYTQELL